MEALDLQALCSRIESDLSYEGLPEHLAFAVALQRKNSFKKFVAARQSTASAAAALSFLEANYLSGEWKFSGDPTLLGQVRNELDKFFHRGPSLLFESYREIWLRGRVGPGVSIGAAGQSFYHKLAATPILTATSLELCNMHSSYSTDLDLWDECESTRSSHGGPNYEIVDASQASFVPKSDSTDRMICIEPAVNTFFQLGLESILRDRLKELWNVDLSVQPDQNRLLAKIGSRDGTFATLDLSSASDRLSVGLARLVLPEWVFETLMDLRTGIVNLKDFGLKVELCALSTMGNGFTFPIMTIILSAILRAVYRCKGIQVKDNPRIDGRYAVVPGNWAVFGDDIICVTEAYADVVEALHSFGFQVNGSKSFSEGAFRESCGGDFYNGHSIRSFYLKRLDSRQDVAVAINLMNEWCARTGLSMRSSVRYLMESCKGLPMVPYADPMDAGVRVPSSVARGEVRSQKRVYTRYESRPCRVRFTDSEVLPDQKGRRILFNGAGALLSLLRGELRNGMISVRHNARLYRTRRAVTPYWDYMPGSVWVNPRADWLRWKAAVEHNVLDLESILTD